MTRRSTLLAPRPSLRSAVRAVVRAVALSLALGSLVGCVADRPEPPATSTTTEPGPQFVSIAAGRQFTCALDLEGTAWCWGTNTRGQLGLGDTLDRFVPTRLQQSVPFAQLAVGKAHVCARDTSGAVHCWGDNTDFALADSVVRIQARPRTVTARGALDVSAGAQLSCMLDEAQRAYCWGADRHGERGDGEDTVTATATPKRVQTTQRFTTLAVGRSHVCALTPAGNAWCWGEGGALGDGSLRASTEPIAVEGAHQFTSLTAGESISCGIAQDSLAYCWGIAYDGQLGEGASAQPNTLTPVAVAGGHRFSTIDAGFRRVCALDEVGAAWCWGTGAGSAANPNRRGSESVADSVQRSATPVRIAADQPFAMIALGDFHSCALDRAGAAWCWGQNADARSGGALGDGTVRNRELPTRVAPPPRP